MRNHSIDTLRFVCAFLVVLIHTGSGHDTGTDVLFRAAVPVFFLISGYFLHGGDVPAKIAKSARRTAIVLCRASVLYFPLRLIGPSAQREAFLTSLPGEALRSLLLGTSPVYTHLWYLHSFLYVLGILWVVEKRGWWTAAYRTIVPLWLLSALLSFYFWNDTTTKTLHLYSLNFLLSGVPYVLLGAWVRQSESKGIVSRLLRSPHACTALLLVGGLLTLGEGCLYNRVIAPALHHELATVTLPFLSLSIFLFALSHPQTKPSVWATWGAKYSLYIYILHQIPNRFHQIPVQWCNQGLHTDLSLSSEGLFPTLYPLLLFGVTLGMSAVVRRTKIFG